MANGEFEDENKLAATEHSEVDAPRPWWRMTPKTPWFAGNMLLVALLVVVWYSAMSSGALTAAPEPTATIAPIQFVTPTSGQTGAGALPTVTPSPTATSTRYFSTPTATSAPPAPTVAPTAMPLSPDPTPTTTPQSQN
jgi:hypothetical protein